MNEKYKKIKELEEVVQITKKKKQIKNRFSGISAVLLILFMVLLITNYIPDITNQRELGEADENSGIKAIDALHLNEDYTFISNIYDEIKVKDDFWGEPIVEHELVRVTYEQDLVDGRVIDFYARSTGEAYIEIYQAGTTHLVGKSELLGINKPGWHYITMRNMTHPTALFDFKVIPVEDHSSEKISVIFDYIHDKMISSTAVEGLVAYQDINKGVTTWLRWNETSNFTNPENTLDGGIDMNWIVVRSAPTRDEMIMGLQDGSMDVSFQIFNDSSGNGNWSTLLTASLNAAPGIGRRGFDVAYEDLSGDALLLYQNNSVTATHPFIQFRTWNGTSFSTQSNITMRDTTGYEMVARTSSILLIPKPRTDTIMAIIVNTTNTIFAVPWNGSAFNLNHSLVITNVSRSDTNPHFNFAWEHIGGEGLAAYSDTTSRYIRSYSPITGWGEQITIDNNGPSLALEMCSDPESDYIGIISQDSGNDQNVSMWNGSEILSDGPAQDSAAEAPSTSAANFACAWYNSTTALFAYTSKNAFNLSYFTFTKPNIWSVTSLLSAPQTVNFATDQILNIQFNKHPGSGEMMIFAADLLNNVTAIRWMGNGTFFSIGDFPLDGLKLQTTTTEGFFFEWFRFDSPPNVTGLVPALNSEFTVGTTIEISANITDNLPFSNETFTVNLTYPNSSIQQLTIRNSTGNPSKFNASFTIPSTASGLYTVRFIANDSNDRVNSTETTNFTGLAATPAATTTTTGEANITITSTTSITIRVQSIDFGSGFASGGSCVMASNGQHNQTGAFCMSFRNVTDGFYLENTGNLNLSLNYSCSGNCTADSFIGGTNPAFQLRVKGAFFRTVSSQTNDTAASCQSYNDGSRCVICL